MPAETTDDLVISPLTHLQHFSHAISLESHYTRVSPLIVEWHIDAGLVHVISALLFYPGH